ncbi:MULTISPECIES: protein-L-isoaspartate O-methyltransferase family protein [unclassified Sphingobium]|uniref:protein-L-isoaspartate O-methyltransferase family protein n=1 Tax=unclassified Sphingobium TaxID=2611147 RepID=UPI0022257EF4|nr:MULTISPECIES: protein-L-isoaspartate O-methyltransferase [unclassified Sphingobium]MCW2412904.1 protein-L-isoaspartate(D-aspartate) O-methyltransferase [Sphingobium sp. B8D3D]MCW2414798.1 protein-L-isoaspartate(D-aspartate) O-methyltransferase [Sphingobium sp. B8D3A]
MTEQTFKAMRRAMVESQLRTSDVNDPVILEAILAEPRELYVPQERRSAAYIDRAVPLAHGRALNPPLATARLLVEAAPRAGEKVLLVGAATGYAAALLARLGCTVVAIEEDDALFAHAKAALAGHAGVTLQQGPLAAGFAQGAPYDLLFVDGAIEELDETLVAQLRIGGRAVFARLERGVTRLCIGTRTTGGFGARAFVDWEAVPLPGFARPKTFTF